VIFKGLTALKQVSFFMVVGKDTDIRILMLWTSSETCLLLLYIV